MLPSADYVDLQDRPVFAGASNSGVTDRRARGRASPQASQM